MEDALVQNTLKYSRRAKKVLILVVMEDALVLSVKSLMGLSSSLNPCCNGRCTRTRGKQRL